MAAATFSSSSPPISPIMHESIGFGIVFKEGKKLDKGGAGDHVSADADAGALTDTGVGHHEYRFIAVGGASRHNSHVSGEEYAVSHKSGLALAGGDDAEGVGADYGGTVIFADVVNVKHILNGNVLGKVITSLRPALIASMALCFVNLAGTKMTGGVCAGLFHGFLNGVEHREHREPPVRPFRG